MTAIGCMVCWPIRLDAGDKAGLPMLREVIKYDAVSNSFADIYVRKTGSEPEQVAATERELRAAISNPNQQHAYPAKYMLGFSFYRDRMKDPAKAGVVLRDVDEGDPPITTDILANA